jgi:hypothetical protein
MIGFNSNPNPNLALRYRLSHVNPINRNLGAALSPTPAPTMITEDVFFMIGIGGMSLLLMCSIFLIGRSTPTRVASETRSVPTENA